MAAHQVHRSTRVGKNAAELIALLQPSEPRTSAVISVLEQYPERRRRRAWRIDDAEGNLVGAVAIVRLCFDTWVGHVYCADESAAATVAALLDTLPVMAVTGPATDVRPICRDLSRSSDVFVNRWAVVPHPVGGILPPPTDRTRVATRSDLDSLVLLYEGYEYAAAWTRWQLRSHLRLLVDRHSVIVCEHAGTMTGAVTFTGSTSRYILVNNLTVLPDFRRLGIAWDLLGRVESIASVANKGVSLVISPSNPMSSDDTRVEWAADHYYTVSMRELHRFRGHGRLRRWYRRVRPLSQRAAFEFVDPHDPDRPAA